MSASSDNGRRVSTKRTPRAGPRLRAALLADLELGDAEPSTSVLLGVDAIVTASRRLQAVRATLDADGPVVRGSRGQPRPHPLLAVERSLEDAIARERERLTPAAARLRGERRVRRLAELTRGSL